MNYISTEDINPLKLYLTAPPPKCFIYIDELLNDRLFRRVESDMLDLMSIKSLSLSLPSYIRIAFIFV
jgi:hypothetical protein